MVVNAESAAPMSKMQELFMEQGQVKTRRTNRAPNTAWVIRQCETCGADFNAKASEIDRGYGRFCNQRCYGSRPRPRQAPWLDESGEFYHLPLASGQIALLDVEDFIRLGQFNWSAYKSCFTYYAKRFIRIGDKCTSRLMHREILGLTDPHKLTDHENGNGLDNRRFNIQPCNNAQNQQNRIHIKNKYRGISRSGKRWIAQIRVNGQTLRLGSAATPEDAARLYDTAARKYFGEFARPNFAAIPKGAQEKEREG
jgi:hypothetical protein